MPTLRTWNNTTKNSQKKNRRFGLSKFCVLRIYTEQQQSAYSVVFCFKEYKGGATPSPPPWPRGCVAMPHPCVPELPLTSLLWGPRHGSYAALCHLPALDPNTARAVQPFATLQSWGT